MSEKKTIKVVELQIDRGEAKYDAQGNYTGERELITLTYGDTQWAGHIRNLPFLGITKVEVKRAFGHTTKHKDEANPDDVYQNEEVDVTDDLRKEVSELFNNKKEVPKTAEQERIEKLEAQIAALTSAQKQSPAQDGELTALHAQYKEKHEGKAVPNNKKNDVEWIKSEIAK